MARGSGFDALRVYIRLEAAIRAARFRWCLGDRVDKAGQIQLVTETVEVEVPSVCLKSVTSCSSAVVQQTSSNLDLRL